MNLGRRMLTGAMTHLVWQGKTESYTGRTRLVAQSDHYKCRRYRTTRPSHLAYERACRFEDEPTSQARLYTWISGGSQMNLGPSPFRLWIHVAEHGTIRKTKPT